jgi:AP-3 complex subunit beta
MGGMLTPMSQPSTGFESAISEAAPMFVPTKSVELLNKINSAGLQVIHRFTRSPHLYSHAMVNIQVSSFSTSNF